MTRFLTFVFLATVLSLSEQSSNNELDLTLRARDFHSLPNGYTCFPEVKCYKLYKNWVTFAEAKRICERDGGSLAVIESAKEASALVALYKEHHEPNQEWPRLGFGDFFGKGEFHTIYGNHINTTGYINWYPGEPRITHERNCGAMNMEGKLGTQCCNCRVWFFCEFKGN